MPALLFGKTLEFRNKIAYNIKQSRFENQKNCFILFRKNISVCVRSAGQYYYGFYCMDAQTLAKQAAVINISCRRKGNASLFFG